jgi:hypothetical protein
MVVLPEKARRVEMKNKETSDSQASTSNSPGSFKAKHGVLKGGCWMLKALKIAVALLLAFEFLEANSFAEEKLQVNLLPLGARARSEAPIPVEVKFVWDSTRILEGRLEMELFEGNLILGRYRGGEMALTGGQQRFRVMLPPVMAPGSESQVEVRMRFVTATSTIELAPSVLFLPTKGEISTVIGWCNSAALSGSTDSEGIQKLLLDRFAPPSESRSAKLLTSVVRITPEDLPAHPLAYTPFDVVVLTAQAFTEAGERQLQALSRWVRGGGSLFVCASRNLKPYHVSFLNQLNDSFVGTRMFQTDDAGNLLAGKGSILHLRSGVGRSVILAGENLADFGLNPAEMRDAAAFLWKMRSRQARSVGESGHWDASAISPTPNNYNASGPQYLAGFTPDDLTDSLNYAYSDWLKAQLLNRLMPQTVRLIPFAALIGMLAAFVLMIGPADYFVLGALRRRRFTWILFPSTSIAFTVATVLMANHFLGLHDQRRSLYVVDLAQDGSALRWNQYELVFAARDKRSVADWKNALWAPLEFRSMSGQPYVPALQGRQLSYVPNNPNPYNSRNNYNTRTESDVEAPLYAGTLPVHFQSSEALRQWKPQLNRIFSFEPPPVPLISNWDEVEKAWPDLPRIRASLADKKFFAGDVCVLRSQKSVSADSGVRGIVPNEILSALCAGDAVGLRSLVSQISPTGGNGFEDAQVLDRDANDAALLIVKQIGDDIVVYRRIFYGY